MQIAPPNLAIVSSLNGLPIGTEKRGQTAQGTSDESAAARPASPASDSVERSSKDNVSISPISLEARAREYTSNPAPVYAEIWKGAIKVAQVDIHGHVTSFSGLVASGGGGGVAGTLLAAQRAIQVAQQTGGEIRTAGQALDGQTLLMRARLANAYAT